ncbi:MAG TPA: hypothetical protein VI357_09705 [Mycobacteriales bacterium]
MLSAAPAGAAPAGVTITRSGSLLTVTGDAAANSLTVGRTPAGVITVNGAAVDGTTASILDIVMDGAGGNDTLRLDETNGAMPRIQFLGGEGNDQLSGGSKADSLRGGSGVDTILGGRGDDDLVGDAGNDKVIGGPGDDTVTLGADADQFTWNPGDGNDHVDGDSGTDTLLFNGSDASSALETEAFQFRSNGVRSTITRIQLPAPNDPDDLMSFSGFELVKANLAGGPNGVLFDDFSASDVDVVRVDLGPAVDPARTGGAVNIAQVFGSEASDRIRIGGSPAAGATVTGLGPTVVITRAQHLMILGLASGPEVGDLFDASLLAAGTVPVFSEVGGSGDDILIGSPGDDSLIGAGGTDRFELRGGTDTTDATSDEVVIP